jgi:hypothetical protein
MNDDALRTCKNCKLMRREECAGIGGPCPFFEYVVPITAAMFAHKPQMCDANRYRRAHGYMTPLPQAVTR